PEPTMSLSHNPPRGGSGQIRAPLRLVSPAPSKPPPKRPAPLFLPDEENRIRAALRHARVLFRGWVACAAVLHVSSNTANLIASGKRPVTALVALRLARALETPLEALYRAPADASTCPHCGAR